MLQHTRFLEFRSAISLLYAQCWPIRMQLLTWCDGISTFQPKQGLHDARCSQPAAKNCSRFTRCTYTDTHLLPQKHGQRRSFCFLMWSGYEFVPRMWIMWDKVLMSGERERKKNLPTFCNLLQTLRRKFSILILQQKIWEQNTAPHINYPLCRLQKLVTNRMWSSIIVQSPTFMESREKEENLWKKKRLQLIFFSKDRNFFISRVREKVVIRFSFQ